MKTLLFVSSLLLADFSFQPIQWVVSNTQPLSVCGILNIFLQRLTVLWRKSKSTEARLVFPVFLCPPWKQCRDVLGSQNEKVLNYFSLVKLLKTKLVMRLLFSRLNSVSFLLSLSSYLHIVKESTQVAYSC